MAERTEANCLDAKSSKKYAVLKNGTENWFWMMKLCLIKENVEDVPNSDVADINLTNKKKNPPLPKINLWQSLYNKVALKWITFVE